MILKISQMLSSSLADWFCFWKRQERNIVISLQLVPKSIGRIIYQFFHLTISFCHSFAVVSCGFEVNQTWLQIGYKKVADAEEWLKKADNTNEKRWKSVVLHEKIRSGGRVGITKLSWSNPLVPVWSNLVDPPAKKYKP